MEDKIEALVIALNELLRGHEMVVALSALTTLQVRACASVSSHAIAVSLIEACIDELKEAIPLLPPTSGMMH